MKNMRMPLLIFLCVTIVGILFGTFFDFKISSAIASSSNGFGLFVSAVGPTLGFCGITFIGGGFIALAIKGDYKLSYKIIFYALAILCYAGSLYYSGSEYFGVNGFYQKAPVFVGYLIAAIPLGVAVYLGYLSFKDNQNKNMWIVFLICLAVFGACLLGTITVLKDIMHRPRFRTVSSTEVPFYNWYQPCKNYKEYMSTLNIAKEEFKSFPSGHTAEASIVLIPIVFMPLSGNEIFKKHQLKFFICGCLFIMLVGFARILAAAHYLSDVSTGAFLMTIILTIANEIVQRIKPLQLEENLSNV